jgi:lysophospholipase
MKQARGQYDPQSNSIKYEFYPFEFGSWDRGVSAFMPMEYLGTNIINGQLTVLSYALLQADSQWQDDVFDNRKGGYDCG